MHRSQRSFLAAVIAVLLAACGGGGSNHSSKPTATATIAPNTATPVATSTAAATATTAHTATAAVTATPTSTLAPSPTPTASPTAAVGAVAQFSVDALNPDNPFPTDRLLDDTGHVHLSGAYLAADVPADSRYDGLRTYLDNTVQSANQLTGFSPFAPIRVRFDTPVADGAVPDGSVLIVQADPPFAVQSISAIGVAAGTAGANVIEIQPRLPLDAKARYVYIVTTAVRDADGHPIRRDPDLTAALHGDVPSLAAWRDSLEPVRQHLSDITLDDIAMIDTFTTQPTTDDLVSIVGQFTSGKLPAAQPNFDDTSIPGLVTGIFAEGTPGFTQYVGSATSPFLAAVAVGTFNSYDFRYGPQQAFDPAKVAGDVTPSTNDVDFYMTIPKDPPPPGGYPITIFGHGLGQSGQDTITIGSLEGADAGVLIGISDVEQGRRGNLLSFFNFNDALATRENFRQSVADIIQLVRMIRAATVPPFDQVDKSRIRYFGVSLGGIMGSMFMGYEPDVEVGMLSVPGGGLPSIIQSDVIGGLLQPMLAEASGVPLDDPFFPVLLHEFIITAQWLGDAGDPINVAPFVIDPDRRLPGVPPKRILMHEGMHDSVVPNQTTDNLALAMGLADVKATHGCSSDSGCSGIWRFVMSEYGQDPTSGHLVTFIVPPASQQAKQFLLSDGTEIIDAPPSP
jgi:hypothetical protein